MMPKRRRWPTVSSMSSAAYTSTLEIAEDMVKAEVEKRRVRWVILSRGER